MTSLPAEYGYSTIPSYPPILMVHQPIAFLRRLSLRSLCAYGTGGSAVVAGSPDSNRRGFIGNLERARQRHAGATKAPQRLLLLLFSLLVCFVGCAEEEGIVEYRIPKKVPAQLLPGKDRMLAVMVPRGNQVWFFKVMGAKDSVDLIDKDFRTFVEGIQFDDQNQPVLENLPEGWRRGGSKPLRFATIDINTAKKQLDLSISSLGAPASTEGAAWESYVKQNVDRWRGQVGLSPSSQKWAGGEPIELADAQGQAIWVDLEGQSGNASSPMMGGGPMSGAPMMGGPFSAAGGAGRSNSGETAPPKSAASSTSTKRLKYETPEGWAELDASGMREAAFKIGEGDPFTEVTIITAGGDLRSNVARWMRQVAGDAVPESAVDQMLEDAEKFQVAGREAQRFIIAGDDEKGQKSIDATIVEMESGRSKFIKMTGDAKTVAEQSKSMRTFLDSLSF